MSPGRNEVHGEKYEALEYASFSLYIKYGESAIHGYQISSLTKPQILLLLRHVKNDHPVFCVPNEFPLIPQNTETLCVSIVLLHITSVIRVSLHTFRISLDCFKALGTFVSFV